MAGLTLQTTRELPLETPEGLEIPDARERLPAARSDPAWRRTDLWLSLVLAAIVGVIWLAFSWSASGPRARGPQRAGAGSAVSSGHHP